MTILAGGALAYGGIQVALGNIRTHLHSPGQVNTLLDQWARLVPDPLGRDFHVLRCRINQSDYAAVPENNKVTYGKRSEMIIKPEMLAWGQIGVYYWRFVIDPKWTFLPGETTTILHQIHEVGSSAAPPANPVFAAVYGPTGYQILWRHDLIPSGQTLYSANFQPGDEVEVCLRVRWADVSHVAASSGIFELEVNGQSVFTANGEQNTWDVPEDALPPYLTAGCYRYDPLAAWWANGEKTSYHVAFALGDESETCASIRKQVNDQLAQSST